jgi:predicted phosphoribosyltransferase
MTESKIHDVPDLRNRAPVFQDREEVGEILARMLRDYQGSRALVLAIPRGALVIGAVIARKLDLALDTVVVAKITPPWNPEFGFGGVAWEGTVWLDQTLVPRLGLRAEEIEQAIWRASDKVEQRSRVLRGERPFPPLAGRTVIVVDDGLATGSTMRVAVQALRKAGASELVAAVGTGHHEALWSLAQEVEAVYCPNLRETRSFAAVGEAYRNFDQVEDEEAARILREFAGSAGAGGRAPREANGEGSAVAAAVGAAL